MSERISVASDQLQLFAMSFVLPGLVPLFALASVNPAVGSWFGGASSAPTLAGVFFVVLGAVAVGFVINAVRFAIYERTHFGGCLVAPSPTYDLTNRQKLDTDYRDLRRSFYFHYLAYSNLSIAFPIAALLWIAGTQLHANDPGARSLADPVVAVVVIASFGLAWLLGAAGCESLRRYNTRRGDLLGYKTPPAA